MMMDLGHFQVEHIHWKNDDTVIINYSFGSGDVWKTEEINFK